MLLDKHTDHEALLEETDHSNEALPDGTSKLLLDETVGDKVSLVATEHTNELLPDETSEVTSSNTQTSCYQTKRVDSY